MTDFVYFAIPDDDVNFKVRYGFKAIVVDPQIPQRWTECKGRKDGWNDSAGLRSESIIFGLFERGNLRFVALAVETACRALSLRSSRLRNH